ncbi:uncharacterized protein K489DRAFT_410210 [Dissoconium aciculare CBS 342.82]|uniref:Uncharacterized protein n=1 Tax=Dissoconium aciculare CBS 342.82 TaxID=1314786 RepID=A0A6J3M531_9PEZI|nr:uncharacterized protein K489DRAFT_410210 [Dissoconium aciculare CBS 342.82]KAF1823150.1 hypothetical protein K489DRAFT_410210 [Dissoconium aciculare CBS 342.82]
MFWVNFSQVFIGDGYSESELLNAAIPILFQVGAKLQEILCVASLATIILQVIHYDILSRDGVPFGLLTSHFWFSMGPHTLFHPEFFIPASSLISTIYNDLRTMLEEMVSFCRTKWPPSMPWIYALIKDIYSRNWIATLWQQFLRIRLVLLILIFAILAVVVGPSTALILTPRTLSFAAGGTDYFIPLTPDQLWPSVVDTSMEHPICALPNATLYPICPCSGYSSIRRHLPLALKADNSVPGWSYPIQGPTDILPSMLSTNWEAKTSQPMAYSALMLELLATDWFVATKDVAATGGRRTLTYESNYQYASQSEFTSTDIFPTSAVCCSEAQDIAQEDDSVYFRVKKGDRLYGCGPFNNTQPAKISHLQRTRSSHLRLQWIPLDSDVFGAVTAGAVLELPWSASSDTRAVLACAITSAWVPGTVSRLQSNNHSWVADGSPASRLLLKTNLAASDSSAKDFARFVNVSVEWLQALAPIAPDVPAAEDGWRPSTLENVFAMAGLTTLMRDLRQALQSATDLPRNMTDAQLYNSDLYHTMERELLLEQTLSRAITDGLSRRLVWQAYNMTGPLRLWSPHPIDRLISNPDRSYGRQLLDPHSTFNAVNLSGPQSVPDQIVNHIDVTVEGLGWRWEFPADYFQFSIAIIYLWFSLWYIVLTVACRETSSSWDTISEMVLLAWNSASAPRMHGTSGGIKYFRTFDVIVKVEATTVHSTGTAEHDCQEAHLLIHEPGGSICATVEEHVDTSMHPTDSETSSTNSSPTSTATTTGAAGLQSASTKHVIIRRGPYEKVVVGEKYC